MTDNGHSSTLKADAERVKDGSQRHDASHDRALATTIIDVTRDLARSLPPPRGAPYFYLDSDAAYDLQVLDALCTRGIFRKYEFALDISSGLGGRARWLAARSGCRVLGIDPRPGIVAAAALLNHRARMDDQVRFQCGRLEQLPLRGRVFTHAWMVDVAAVAGTSAIFGEAFRVLRPGAHFALQGQALGPHRERLLDALRAVGFIELEVREVGLADPPHAQRVARERLRIAGRVFDSPPRMSTCLQIFARRPA